jgi:hypothetical protein
MKIRDIEWRPGTRGDVVGYVGETRVFAILRKDQPANFPAGARTLHGRLMPDVPMFTDVDSEEDGKATAGRMLAEFVSQFVEED